MKRIFSALLTLLFLYTVSFAQQNDCGNNAGFESGNTNGWVCKSGYYGAAPCPPSGTCPRMGTVYNGGKVSSGVINAAIGNAGDRHTMVNAAGGNDPNATTPAVPMLCPGGGNYSFRLGNGNTGVVNGSNSEAEAIRLTFPVSASNAGFTYQYAFFVANPGHPYESQPSFEVVVLDYRDSIIPCGRYFVVAGTTPAGCVNSAGFVNGANGYVYKAWSSVGLDLTGYIGQNVSVEFRTTDCMPPGGGSTSTSCSGTCCTLTSGGSSCTYCSPATTCTPAGSACSYAAGTHSAYAYIDAYCTPLTIAAPVFCAGAASIQICAPAGYVSYSWPAGQPGITGSPTTQCVTVNNPVSGATYTVNLVSATGCPTKTTVTLQGAMPSVNSPTICAGSPTTLTATGGTGSYTWSTGSNSSSIVVAPTVTTTYTVTTVATGTVNCPSSATATVTVGTIAATITPPVTICSGGSATLTTTGGGTYLWSNGATSPSIPVSPGTTTTYSVEVTNGLCKAVGNTTVTVAPITASVSPPTTICLGSSTSFTASGGTTYSWSTGDLTPSITVTPTASATYTVIAFNSSGCSDTVTTSVTVNSVSPTISGPVTICTGDIATITATGGGTYAWNPGGSTSPGISVSPAQTTTYSVTVTNGGCSSTLSQTITVNTFVKAILPTPPPICVGSSVTLTASGGNNYSWSTGSLLNPIVVTPTVTTTYSVVVSSGTSCIDSTSTTVVVNPLPVPTITPNTTICLGSTTNFTAGGGTSYLWSTGSNQNPLVVTPTASATYSVLVTDANGCTGVIAASVVVNPIPSPTSTSAKICMGSTATLTATGGTTYTWNNGQTGPSLVDTPGSTTTYTVTVANAGGCTSTAVGTITVVPAPTAVFTNSAPCEGASVSYTDGSLPAQGDPISTWSWSMTGGVPAVSTNQNPISTYPTAGTYTTTLTITSQTGCTNTVSQTVIIYANPIALFSGGDSACASLCHTFMDASQAVNGTLTAWQWSFPGGNPSSSTLQNPLICYNTPGAYGASLMVTTNYGCKDTFALTPVINVYPVPHADFCVTPDKAPATDPVFNFCPLWTPNPGVTSWIWNFGDGTTDSTSTITNPVHSYSATVTGNDFYFYTVTLLVKNQHGCWDTVSKTVELIPEFTFYIPNSFTPNGDVSNELFFGKGRGIKEYNIWLFDRWGNMIWDCHYTGKNNDWDGAGQDGMPSVCKWNGVVVPGGADMNGRSGQSAQEDVYVWKVKLTDVFDKKHTYVGHVSIVK